MKAKFLAKAGRFVNWLALVILLVCEVYACVVVLTNFNQETAIFAVAGVVALIPTVVCFLNARYSSGAELVLQKDRVIGKWRGKSIDCPLATITKLYASGNEKDGGYLHLCTTQGNYCFFGMLNSTQMADAICAALPLPAQCRNASDELLLEQLKEKKRMTTRWGILTVAVALLALAAGVGGILVLARELSYLFAIVAFGLAMVLVLCLTVVSGRGYWSKQ